MTLFSTTFLELEVTYFLLFFFCLSLVYNSIKNIYGRLKAKDLVNLGYGSLIFLDMVSFHFVDFQLVDDGIQRITITYSMLSFLLYMIGRNITGFKTIETNLKENFNILKFDKRILPISIVFLLIFSVLSNLYPEQSKNPVFTLISFLPKATSVLLFYLFLRYKKKKYIYYFIFFILLSLTETSRRIYITLFFVLLPILIAYIKYRKIRLSFKVKFFLISLGITFFFFLNYLRSDHDFGDGYIEGDRISNTIDYMVSMRSIDTYYNTCFIIENFPEKYSFYLGETYTSVLFMFVPRSIWADKPIGFAAPLGMIQRTGLQVFDFEEWRSFNQYSLSPGFIGEAYANFGITGILILSFLLGRITCYFDLKNNINGIFKNISSIINYSWMGCFFLLLRGDFFSAVYFSIFYFIYLKLILRFCKN